MVRHAVTPWHQVVRLRDDLRTGELSLSLFAADLYDVVMGRARPLYQQPEQFFALTYPTFNLRELVRDVVGRLAGRNDKAVRQLELTYGGGKTHALITLYHLVRDPDRLPDLAAVREFREHAGIPFPRARVAVLPFDKLDVEKGMEVRGPSGELRWLRQPWSVLAFQLAGPEGLRLLHAEGRDEERDTPPAENLMRDLLELAGGGSRGRPEPTLLLVDEVLMYAREKVGQDPVWRHRLQDFFQVLTQAVTKVDRTCIVASLLATDPRKSDALGKEIAQELYNVFRRECEAGVLPVERQDVAEILRRRFFTPESVQNREAFRAHVVAALAGIEALDEQTRRNRQTEEERYLDSYPFHPDLTEALYTKWTQLEGFQRTRGVLRTFAMALRDAEKWDTAPLVGVNVFLSAPGDTGLSEAARELAAVAGYEEYEGKRQDWAAILEGELGKVRDIQRDFLSLRGRELEQAVMATFVHSQPIGQRALTRELLVLLGLSRPDPIELEKGLRRWAEVSWFLDETALTEAGNGGLEVKVLPKTWRLGTRPNLKQMHSQALAQLPPDLVEQEVRKSIEQEKRLTAGAAAEQVHVHKLPKGPGDISDDGEFHYVVLGPEATSDPGKPSTVARRFLSETTGPDNPRVYRNAVVVVVPSREGLEALRSRVRDHLAWREVAGFPEAKNLDEARKALLQQYTQEAQKRIGDAVRQAYNIVVTVGAKGEIEAFRITPGDVPLFETVKKDPRTRIREAAVSPDALLPGGPYELWREGETSRRASDLITAFAQFPHLPKMLRRRDIMDTLALGCAQGYLVLRLVRPDRSVRTIWRVKPSYEELEERGAELVLPQAAELSHLDSSLIGPGLLPGLWPADADSVALAAVFAFFDGCHTSPVDRGDYTEHVPVPAAPRVVVEAAVREAVKSGQVWLITRTAGFWREEVPAGVLTDDAILHRPPAAINPTELLPQNLPGAWVADVTTAAALADGLSQREGKPLPWPVVRSAIDDALRMRLLELTPDSATWPCDSPNASSIRLRVAEQRVEPDGRHRRARAEATLRPDQVQTLAEVLSDVVSKAAGLELTLSLRIDLEAKEELSASRLHELNEVLRKVSDQLQFPSPW